MILRPITTEKAIKLLDTENTLVFETSRGSRKEEIKSYVEHLFNVKTRAIRTHIRKNKKLVYVRLVKENPASDVATKIGVI